MRVLTAAAGLLLRLVKVVLLLGLLAGIPTGLVTQIGWPLPRQLPTLDAANISFNLLKITAGEGITVGPMLLGAAKPVHILTPTATVRRLVNMAALASVDAAFQRQI